MLDMSRAQRELTKEETYAVNWLDAHGFDVTLERQSETKIVCAISKDGILNKLRLTRNLGGMTIEAYMEQFGVYWKTLRELERLRLNRKGG